MNIKHPDLEIDQENPFSSCKLDRKKYAEVLTSIVGNYADGFVLAINNEWGTGKTTFVKMWEQHLINKEIKTLYFNAWENDFESNPLVAIMSELQTLKKKSNATTYKSLLEKGAILTKNIVPAVVKAVAKRYIDSEELVDGLVDSTEAAAEILEKEVNEYASRKKSLKEFRSELVKFIQETNGGKPIVFIIDELDRCKPNYAVEVLEQMKHFFAVKGIIFVLAIDKIQLGHAMRGVYGSEQLNADEYLRRFIDIEYSIPTPDTKQFCSYLFEYFGFDEFFNSKQRQKYPTLTTDRESLISTACLLFEKKNVTLRQQEKIFSHARIALKSFNYNTFLFPNLFLFLIYSRTLHKEFYRKIEGKEYTLQELADGFYQIVPDDIGEYDVRSFLYLEAHLVNMYHNYKSLRHGPRLFDRNNDGEEKTVVRSKLDKSEQNDTYISILKSVTSDWEKSEVSIAYLLKRINLIDPVIT